MGSGARPRPRAPPPARPRAARSIRARPRAPPARLGHGGGDTRALGMGAGHWGLWERGARAPGSPGRGGGPGDGGRGPCRRRGRLGAEGARVLGSPGDGGQDTGLFGRGEGSWGARCPGSPGEEQGPGVSTLGGGGQEPRHLVPSPLHPSSQDQAPWLGAGDTLRPPQPFPSSSEPRGRAPVSPQPPLVSRRTQGSELCPAPPKKDPSVPPRVPQPCPSAEPRRPGPRLQPVVEAGSSFPVPPSKAPRDPGKAPAPAGTSRGRKVSPQRTVNPLKGQIMPWLESSA